MGMNVGSGSGSDEPEVMMDINTTPLIDVMLVLLIMLIITIPAQLHSVNLDMPVSTPPTKKVEPVVVKIDVDASSVINWNGKPIAGRADLEAKLLEASAMQAATRVAHSLARQSQVRVCGVGHGQCAALGLEQIGHCGLRTIRQLNNQIRHKMNTNIHPIDSRLLDMLKSDTPLKGIFNSIPCPAIVEMCGYAGFDFVVIDNEHGSADFQTTENMLRAARSSGITPIVRCFERDIPRVLRHGCQWRTSSDG